MSQVSTNLDQFPQTAPLQDEFIKFVLSRKLKINLQKLAHERNISLSALMRLIASDYLKRNQNT
jgi:hypothetical protein